MWRKLIYLYLIYIVAEGALRKWVLPEFSNQIFILKDFILAGAFIAMANDPQDFRDTRFLTKGEVGLWGIWVGLFCLFAILAGFSITTFAGLRYYLAAVPLAFVVAPFIKNWETLERLVMVALYLTIGVCILGFIQYASPTDSAINQYAWKPVESDVISTFGVQDDQALGLAIDRARITGTFSYISTYASFLQFVFMIAWVAALTIRSRKYQLVAFAALLVIFINIAMTGSRAPLVIAVALSIPFFIVLVRSAQTRGSQIGAVLVLITAMTVGLYFFSDPISLVLARDQSAGDAEERITGAIFTPIATFMSSSLLGQGMGTTFGGLAEWGIVTTADFEYDEVNLDRIGVETGVIGYLFALIVKVVYLAKTWKLVRRARSHEIRVWTLAILGYQLALLWSIPVYNSVANAFYFSALGLFYWLRHENAKIDPRGLV